MVSQLKFCPDLKNRLERLSSFYNNRPQDMILASMDIPRALDEFASKYPAGPCPYPDISERIEFWSNRLHENINLEDDSIPSAYLSELDQGLYGAIVGGKIEFLADPSLGRISSMVHNIISEWSEFENLSWKKENEWYQRYLSILRAFAKDSLGRYGVNHFILIDGLNFIFELRGATKAYLDLYENTEMVRKAMDFAFDLNVQVQEDFFRIVPQIGGGTCSDIGHWLPGKVVSESLDPFHMTSVQCFLDWGLENVEKMFDKFDGGVVHIHSNGRHLLEAVSSIKGLKAILLLDEQGAPPAFEIVSDLKSRTGNIPLILFVEYERFKDALNTNSLCGGVFYNVKNVPDLKTANRLMETVRFQKIL